MRNVAGFALTTSALFLAVVALLIQAPSLFYMGTALFVTIGAGNLQAWLAVRGLRFERVPPGSARLGDEVTIETVVWSERRLRRPLVIVQDRLPQRLNTAWVSPSLPVAPSYDLPVRTRYRFVAKRRGVYRWNSLLVIGTDALGLVTKTREYRTDPVEIVVAPRPIPVSVELPVAAGWGISEAESGRTRGAGIEPRGVREYTDGDSLRHVHWRSSARAGRLLVKEFEAGTHASAAFLLQHERGSDVGEGTMSSLDLACGHALFLADELLRRGTRVVFPTLEDDPGRATGADRLAEIGEMLARVQAGGSQRPSDELAALEGTLPPGSVVFLLMTVPDPGLPTAAARFARAGGTVVPMLYDARAFDPKARESACDPAYADDLRAARLHPVTMPTNGEATA